VAAFQYLIQFHSVCVMFHQYHHTRCIPLEPPIHFGSTQTHCNTRVKPLSCVHIETILLFYTVFPLINYPIGGTVYHLPSTVQLPDAILIALLMIFLCIVLFVTVVFVFFVCVYCNVSCKEEWL